jgi:putative serine protease PepD
MGLLSKSHIASAIVGGLIVAGGVAVFGVGDGQRAQTIFEQSPEAAQIASDPASGLTPNDIYERYAPGVVFVRAKLIEDVQSPFDLFHQGESDSSTGSGFLVDRRGDILTNYHLIAGADRSGGVTVEFEGNTSRSATVVAADPHDDLAVLRVNMRGVAPVLPLRLGDSTTVRVGDPTLTIGDPFGVDRTLTSGIVSALQHQIRGAGGETIDNVIQTDQAVAAGNSGGPLLDSEGRVVGINSQIVTGTPGGGGESLAFAVPIDTATAVLARVAQTTAIQVAYLGLEPARGRLARSGSVVGHVDHDGPAAQAGVRPGDTILRVDGTAVASINDVLSLVSTLSPHNKISLRIRRGHELQTVPVVLGSRTVPSPGG